MNRRHILVVDDDTLNSGALQRHLESQGFEVTIAENCAEGEQALASKSKIDLVILDHLLPDGPSTDLLRLMAFNDRLQKPPVIMSSSLVDRGDVAGEEILNHLPAFSQSLVQAYVPKPYSLDNMHTVVDLIFESTPSPASEKTIETGDFRPPKRSRR